MSRSGPRAGVAREEPTQDLHAQTPRQLQAASSADPRGSAVTELEEDVDAALIHNDTDTGRRRMRT